MGESKTILVTGACGFVGTNLVKYLSGIQEFDRVIVCCRDRKVAATIVKSHDRLIFTEANLADPSTYQTIFKIHNPNYIIHLAAIARFKQGEKNPDATVKINFFGTIELLKLAKQFKTKKVLVVSSNLARNPKGVTGISKYLTEAYIKNIQPYPEVSCIRLPNVIDSPGAVTLLFKEQIRKGLPITITDNRMSRKFVTPQEAGNNLVFALLNGNHGDLFINNKPSTPIVNLAQKMIDESGKSIPIQLIGMRPGEKLQEEDYPKGSVAATSNHYLYRLTEEQHSVTELQKAIGLLAKKVHNNLTDKIKATFHLP
ncbi:MAG: hypothetical protein DRJ09_00750 [Bacteroidetes bacterium]|nr:MAG: hypothetical protein DRJ09_00750 [Bacteroidota bacterium]